MNKKIKLIIYSLVFVIACYTIYFVYGIIKYSHSLDWSTYNQYLWVFNEQIKKDIDYDYSYSYVQKSDIYNNIHCKNYNIIVWEFKNIEVDKIEDISINKDVALENIKFRSGEVLNKNSDLEITVEYGFSFNNGININLDHNSNIDTTIINDKYIGFYGSINKLSLSNGENEHPILFDYTLGNTPTLFLIYEKEKKYYVILVNSKESFDENVIDIFNLS